jgi:hypothetical protein
MPVLTLTPVIEPVTIANVEALLAAIPPDRELDEPGEDLRESAVELPSIDCIAPHRSKARAMDHCCKMSNFTPAEPGGLPW